MSANTHIPPGLLFIRLVFTVEYFSMNSISFGDCSQRKSHVSHVYGLYCHVRLRGLLKLYWPACVDFLRAFLMSSSTLLLSLISSCWVFNSRSFCRSTSAFRAWRRDDVFWVFMLRSRCCWINQSSRSTVRWTIKELQRCIFTNSTSNN